MAALLAHGALMWPLAVLFSLWPSALALRRYKTGWSSTDTGTDAVVDLTRDEALSLVRGSCHRAAKSEPGYYDGNTPPIVRIGLPALKMQYGASGFRSSEPSSTRSATSWPSPLALASTWDEELVSQVAAAVGREFHGKGANVMLGPSLALGQGSESLSGEDPYLGARIAPAFVRGLQGEGVMCAVRGFGNAAASGGGKSKDTVARTAWELHYPPFEAAVRAGTGAVVCANGELNSTVACHNEVLLRGDLRTSMGFRGMVLSEVGAAVDPVQALEAGVDVELSGGIEGLAEPDPVLLELATVRVRTAMVQVGLKADSCVPPNCTEQLHSVQTNSQQRALALKAAVSAVTLLKNDGGLLPFDPAHVRKFALLGSAARSRLEYYTDGVVPQRLWSTLEAVTQRASRAKVEVRMIAAPNAQVAQRVLELEGVEAVVVVVGGGTSLGLDDGADQLIEAVGALGKPTAVLMQTAGAVLTPWRDAPHVKSIANIFLGGEETGAALAAVLFGDEAPGGRLPVVFPADAAPCEGCAEGLFSSYRSPALHAAFPFGHGLSYTEFALSDPCEVTAGCAGTVCVNATVTNVGARAGSEVVQAYVEFAPGLGEPSKLLRGFRKLHLRPGESQTLSFAFTERDLSIYYPDGGWELQGAAQVYVGLSSSDLREPVLVRIP